MELSHSVEQRSSKRSLHSHAGIREQHVERTYLLNDRLNGALQALPISTEAEVVMYRKDLADQWFALPEATRLLAVILYYLAILTVTCLVIRLRLKVPVADLFLLRPSDLGSLRSMFQKQPSAP